MSDGRERDDRKDRPPSAESDADAPDPRKKMQEALRRLADCERRLRREASSSDRHRELTYEVQALRDEVLRLAQETVQELTAADAHAEPEPIDSNVRRLPRRGSRQPR
jgi:hypothetical protein